MKKIIFVICLLLTTTCSLAAHKESLDQIVAVVNDDVVTTSELNHTLTRIKMQMAQENIPQPSEQVLNKQVLDQLINKKLQLQIAKQAGIHVTDEDLNNAITQVANQNHVSTAELYQHLKQEGMTIADYRTEMRDQLTVHKLQQQEVVSHVSITPQEVDRFMRSQPWKTNSTNEYRVDDILIPISDTPSPEEIDSAQKRAHVVFTKLNSGENFKEIAQAESADNAHALQGGDLGWRKLPEIPSAFADKIVTMKPKQIAGPIRTSNGFHIIRLAETRAENAGQSANPSRKEVESLLLQRKFEEAVQNWVSKLRNNAVISMKPNEANAMA